VEKREKQLNKKIMIIKTLIITVILVAIVILALGIKMLFDKNAKFEIHSCALDNDSTNSTCYKCQVKDPVECNENIQ